VSTEDRWEFTMADQEAMAALVPRIGADAMRNRRIPGARARPAVLCVVMLTVVSLGVFMLWPPAPRLTKDNVQRLQESAVWIAYVSFSLKSAHVCRATRSQVEEYLGPPGDYTTRPIVDALDLLGLQKSGESAPGTCLKWDGDEVAVRGHANEDGSVELYIYDVTPAQQGLLDNLLWRAKRQWHRWFP
jgi:hypothetical protein